MSLAKKIVVTILTWEARLILCKYRPTIIAITGSVGKTSTKDAIYSVLKKSGGYVRKSEKSLNSEIGLPLTVIGIPNAWRSVSGWVSNILRGLKIIFTNNSYPDTLVLEVGADHPGDIRKPARWLKPHISVITRISMTPVHVEFFKSPEQVFEEKAALAEHTRSGGVVILFSDEEKILTISDRIKNKNVHVVTYGTGNHANVQGSEFVPVYENGSPVGISFKVDIGGISERLTFKGIIGATHMYPILAAAAVAKARDIPNDQLFKALTLYEPPRGRMNIIRGIKNTTIIDDTYNSSPDATVAALKALMGLQVSGRKIAVLGDMMELGKYSADEHRKIGALVHIAAKELLTVGPRSSTGTADEAMKSGMPVGAVHSYATSKEAIPRLEALIRAGDVILVKGSQSVRMEHIVKALMAEPEKAGELLVRQEREWLEKA